MYGIYENGAVIAEFAAPMTVRSNMPSNASDTLSLKRFGSTSKAQRWEIETALVPASGGAQDLFVNIVTRGYTESTLVKMPQNYGSLLARTATAPASAIGTKGSDQLTISCSGKIPKGSFVNFGSGEKVYMLKSDCDNGGTVSVHPQLRKDVSGTMYYAEDVIAAFFYDTETVRGMMYRDGILMDLGTVKLVEDI